jgi:hypothetical protein
MKTSKLLGITVTVELAKQLEDMAKRDERSVSSLVRKFIADGISKNEAIISPSWDIIKVEDGEEKEKDSK